MQSRYHSFILKSLFLNIPYHPIFVFTAAHHILPGPVKIKLPNRGLVSLNSICAEPIIHRIFIFPAFNCVIIACREKNVLFRVPFHKFNILSVPTRNRHTIEVSIFPLIIGLSNPDSLISTAGCQPFAICAPGDTFDFIFMTFKLLNALESTVSQFPYASGPVKAGTCYKFT